MTEHRQHSGTAEALKADYEAYKRRTGKCAAKTLAAWFNRPVSSVYQWSEGLMEPSLREAIQLVPVLGEENFAQHVCQQWGGAFVKLPEQAGAEGTLITYLREFSQAAEEVSVSLADGRLSALELKRCEREIDEAIESALRLKEFLRKQAAAQPKTTRAM